MKNKILILISLFLILFYSHAFAQDEELNRSDIFQYISEKILQEVPKSYQYIHLNFIDVDKKNKQYEYIQKMVYVDMIENKKAKIFLDKPLNAYVFYTVLEKIIDIDFVSEVNMQSLKSRNVLQSDLIHVENTLRLSQPVPSLNSIIDSEKLAIFSDVYSTLLNEHFDSKNIQKDNLIYGSIEGLAKGSQDKYTTYFPPVESKGFQENLSGEFEGIGAYVEMEKPGELKIISPLSGSPAEKVGLKGGDIVIKVGDTVITKDMTSTQIVSFIKGKAGTTVKIQVLRGDEKIDFDVVRAKIIINDVEYKVLKGNIFYIQMKMFGEKVFTQTNQALMQLKKEPNIKKVIIDLRNNPGGYLDQAVDILSMFIPKGSPVAMVKYKNGENIYKSYGYDTIDLNKYEVYILANSGTASAAEILIGTLKDYFPNIKIIGEKTYGKGSVQTMREYIDGSMLKYTIAKWYTGKSMTGIDEIGISPDKEVILDIEKFKSGIDTQLDYIIK